MFPTTKFPDNVPDLDAAVDLSDHETGNDVRLKEKPHNAVEITPGGPFLLRMLHLKQGSIPESVRVNETLSAGSFVGLAGDSGTAFVPHLHLVFGFFDQVPTHEKCIQMLLFALLLCFSIEWSLLEHSD